MTERKFSVTRRTVLATGVGAAAAGLLPIESCVDAPEAAAPAETGNLIRLTLTVNGKLIDVEIDSRASLLDLLRERLGYTGTKKGCDHGQCGACTVHMNDRAVVSCLTLAAKAHKRSVATIESLEHGNELHPMQRAFIEHDGLQCGYCTPGQIMSAIACVQRGQATNRESIREFMSGNLCRCGAYLGIVAAIEAVAGEAGEG